MPDNSTFLGLQYILTLCVGAVEDEGAIAWLKQRALQDGDRTTPSRRGPKAVHVCNGALRRVGVG